MEQTFDISNTLKPVKAIKVSSVEDLFSIIISENKSTDKWFRGQCDINYPLLPSVIRRAQVIKDQFGRPVKPHPIEMFSTHGDICIIPDGIYLASFMSLLKDKALYNDISSIEDIMFMCMAQHYGVRTKLLDWTTDAIVALFFALDGRTEGNSAGFYILDPVKLNEASISEKTVYNFDNIPEVDLFPIAFYGPKEDIRMCRQSGNFTIHGSIFWPIDYLYVADDFLKRIEIPNHVCVELSNLLSGLGITKESIYVMDDEKDKLALEARNITEHSFEEYLKELTENWKKSPEKGIERHIYF